VAVADDHFVHADRIVRDVPDLAETDPEIVRIEDRELGGSF
jgi:hypothetical protein